MSIALNIRQVGSACRGRARHGWRPVADAATDRHPGRDRGADRRGRRRRCQCPGAVRSGGCGLVGLREAPSRVHLFGTDDLGRDILSRMIHGARASLLASFVSVSIAFAVGVPIGLCSGYLGGVVDGVIMRFTDAMLAIPALIFAVSLAAFLGPSLINAVIAIGVSAIPVFVRLSRAQAMAVKHEEYVEAAFVIGNPRWRLVLRHILPNIIPALIVQATLTMAFAVIAEASLSFLGVGQQPPEASWGNMLAIARITSRKRRGWRSGRGPRSFSPCCPLISSATRSRTRSIPD